MPNPAQRHPTPDKRVKSTIRVIHPTEKAQVVDVTMVPPDDVPSNYEHHPHMIVTDTRLAIKDKVDIRTKQHCFPLSIIYTLLNEYKQTDIWPWELLGTKTLCTNTSAVRP